MLSCCIYARIALCWTLTIGGRRAFSKKFKVDKFIKATSFLSSLDHWATACQAAVTPVSAGKLYYLAGAGTGSMTIEHQRVGILRTLFLFFGGLGRIMGGYIRLMSPFCPSPLPSIMISA